MWCFHRWGELNESNCQTCSKCGKVEYRGSVCLHQWKKKDSYTRTWPSNSRKEVINVMECELCGELDTKSAWI